MGENNKTSILEQLRQTIKDAVDYLASALSLLQARLTDYALSAVLFTVLILIALVLGLAGFVLLNIALGLWLAQLTGHAAWSLLILGAAYAFLAVLSSHRALAWLKKLKS